MTHGGRLALVVMAGLAAALAGAIAMAQDDYAAQREAMVDALVADEIITDRRVIDAMRAVPRHEFVPAGQIDAAYEDAALPIGDGRMLIAPSYVGLMAEALAVQPTDRVLEIGTGMGYEAAVLSTLARHVYTVEPDEALAAAARQRLQALGYTNVTLRQGDGVTGWPEQAPFDRIIVNAALGEIPQALIDQLKDGGLMVIPLGEDGWAQKLYLVHKNGDALERTELADVIFAPMTSTAGNGE